MYFLEISMHAQKLMQTKQIINIENTVELKFRRLTDYTPQRFHFINALDVIQIAIMVIASYQ